MKNESILNSPVEVKNESGIYLTLQLSKTTITDASGEKEVCPEIALVCKMRASSGKYYWVMLNVEQVDEFICQLTDMKNGAINYSKSKFQEVKNI